MAEVIKREMLFTIALLTLMVGIFAIFFRMILPFFAPIAWAAVLVITWYPLHRRLSRHVKIRGLAALASTMAVAIVILAPAVYLVVTLAGEASNLYNLIGTGWTSQTISEVADRVNPIVHAWGERFGLASLTQWDFRSVATDAAGKLSGFVVTHATSTLANVGKVGLQFLMMLLTMYYLFKDGKPLVERVKSSIPLPEDRAAGMLSRTTDVVRAAIYGGLFVAAVQGALGGILFLVLGLPSPVLWGAVMGVFALIPFLGAFVVYIPAALVLLADGQTVKAIILLAVGVGIVSQIDNVLRPLIISGRTQLHPLLLFFAIFGGVSVFGFVGLVLGPVIAGVFVAMFDVYRLAIHQPAPKAPAKDQSA